MHVGILENDELKAKIYSMIKNTSYVKTNCKLLVAESSKLTTA
jgi:hypothetical protein